MSTAALVEKALTAYLANPDEAVVQPSDTLFVNAAEFMALKQRVEEMGDRLRQLRVSWASEGSTGPATRPIIEKGCCFSFPSIYQAWWFLLFLLAILFGSRNSAKIRLKVISLQINKHLIPAPIRRSISISLLNCIKQPMCDRGIVIAHRQNLWCIFFWDRNKLVRG